MEQRPPDGGVTLALGPLTMEDGIAGGLKTRLLPCPSHWPLISASCPWREASMSGRRLDHLRF